MSCLAKSWRGVAPLRSLAVAQGLGFNMALLSQTKRFIVKESNNSTSTAVTGGTPRGRCGQGDWTNLDPKQNERVGEILREVYFVG